MPTSKPKIPKLTLSDDKKWFVDLPYMEAGSFGTSKLKPSYLIMHYTAGRGFKETTARFRDPAAKVSAHLVVGRAGELVQMVTFDRPAWHAGADSTYYDYVPGGVGPQQFTHMNFHSIGIEFDNYGPLTKVGSKFRTWFGRDVPANEVAEVDPTRGGSHKIRWWHAYSEVQLLLAERLAVTLVRAFNLRRVLGHNDVCPGRKMDPGPVFPMNHLRAIIEGRGDDETPETMIGPMSPPPSSSPPSSFDPAVGSTENEGS